MLHTCLECRLLFAKLVAAQKEQLSQRREREKVAAVPFAERLRSMGGTEWEQMLEAQRSPRSTEAFRKLRHHQLNCHAGRHF
jgi:hypothetical protein